MDIEIVRKWAKENYPHLAGNDDVIVLLYKKNVLGEEVVQKTMASGVIRESNSLKERENTLILGTLLGKTAERITKVCSICHKKLCEHTDAPKQTLYSSFYEYVDRSGKFEAKYFSYNGDDVKKLDDSQQVLLSGYMEVREAFGAPKFNIRGYTKFNMDEASLFVKTLDFLQLKSVGGKVGKEAWANFMAGVSPELGKKMKSYFVLKEEGDYLVVNL